MSQLTLNVHVYSDSIFKYLPSSIVTDSARICFSSFIKRGATIKSLSAAIEAADMQKGTPHAIVIHAGTNSLANYWFTDDPSIQWQNFITEYLDLAIKMSSLHHNDIPVIVSGIIPRADR